MEKKNEMRKFLFQTKNHDKNKCNIILHNPMTK